jgi:hypothetical protein
MAILRKQREGAVSDRPAIHSELLWFPARRLPPSGRIGEKGVGGAISGVVRAVGMWSNRGEQCEDLQEVLGHEHPGREPTGELEL